MADDLIVLAKQIATQHRLFEHVICGICEQESSWNPWAIRYEPDFEWRYVAIPSNKLSNPTEIKARSISWGLMQTMGQSVRELGYTQHLPMLCDPATGIEWGCRLFAEKLRHAQGDYTQALTIWNGGGNPNYAAEVTDKADKYRT